VDVLILVLVLSYLVYDCNVLDSDFLLVDDIVLILVLVLSYLVYDCNVHLLGNKYYYCGCSHTGIELLGYDE